MDSSINVINSNSGVYLKYDYLMFPINLNIVPKIKIGKRSFYSKNNYHISLLCLEGRSKSVQAKMFKLSQEYKLKLRKITSNYRLAVKKDKQSIIVRVRFVGLKKLIKAINKKFGTIFEYPPTHITLFTLKGQTGIGIDTYKEYLEICRKIGVDDSNRLEKSFRLV